MYEKSCYMCAQWPVGTSMNQNLKCSWFPLDSWIIYSCHLLLCLLRGLKLFYGFFLYDEHAPCLRRFSTLLHFQSSRKQWKDCCPSRLAVALVRQDESTPSKQKQQTGAKRDVVWRQWRRTQNPGSIDTESGWHWTRTLDAGVLEANRRVENIQSESNLGPRQTTPHSWEETKLNL